MTKTYFAKKKKNNAHLGDNRSRNKKEIFLKLTACNDWRIENDDQIVYRYEYKQCRYFCKYFRVILCSPILFTI